MNKPCPNCTTPLESTKFPEGGVYFNCKTCEGRTVGVELLRRRSDPELITKIWVKARQLGQKGVKKCPSCKNAMTILPAPNDLVTVELDICTGCHLIWFDADEIQKIPRATGDELARRKQVERAAEEKRHKEKIQPHPGYVPPPTDPLFLGAGDDDLVADITEFLTTFIDD
jgi:Zn-finger nucleic acid-binding protein